MSTETSCHFSHLLQVLKKSLWSLILYTFYHDFIHVYSPGAGADNPLGKKSYMWTLPDLQGDSLKWSRKFLLKHTTFHQNLEISLVWIKNFPIYSIHFRQTSLKWKGNLPDAFFKLITCMQNIFDVNKNILTLRPLLQISKNVFEVWFYTIFFHHLIHVYSTGAGADSPQGTKFWCQQKGFITLPICCKFQKNLFEVWFYTIFFHHLIHVYSPWDKVLMSTETSCHFGHLLLISNHRRQ